MAFHGSPFEAEIVNERYDYIFNFRIHGKGKYTFTDGKVYVGDFKDGQFDGIGTIHFTNGDKYEAEWKDGIAIKGQFTFKDGLKYEENDWDYCTLADRRFYHERVNGFKEKS
jgi:hypothetical protein